MDLVSGSGCSRDCAIAKDAVWGFPEVWFLCKQPQTDQSKEITHWLPVSVLHVTVIGLIGL